MTEVRPRPHLRAALVLALLALLATLAPPAAQAQTAEWSASTACPSSTVPSSGFTDATGVHGRNIDCLAWYALTAGRTATYYGNLESVRRDQTASFVVRVMERVDGVEMPPRQTNAFSDVDSGPHRVNIEVLAGAEPPIVAGYPDGTYRPTLPLTRAQFASIATRMLDELADQGLLDRLPAASSPFRDTAGSVHEDNIARLANVGVLQGRTATTFDPQGEITRGQTASVLARILGGLVAEELVLQPRRFAGVVHDGTDAAPGELGPRIAGAQIVANGFSQVSTTTDSQGRYALWLQQPSEYLLDVGASGFVAQRRSIVLPSDDVETDLAMYRRAEQPASSTPTASTSAHTTVTADGEFWRIDLVNFDPDDATEIRLRFPQGLVVQLGDAGADAAYFSRHPGGTSDRIGEDSGTHTLYYLVEGTWRSLEARFDGDGTLITVNNTPYVDPGT
jgi:hypothetical protein